MSQKPGAKLQSSGTDFTPTIHHDTYGYINPEQFSLQGRAVFITGASKGVGRATAIAYAKAGASYIAVAARSGLDTLATKMLDAAVRVGKSAPNVLQLSVDVTSEESVGHAAKQAEQAFGRLDILINNAGYLENFVPITESDPKDWWRVNIKGVYLVTRALLPLMLKTENGQKIVLNVSSIGAHFIMPGASGYQSGKLALLRLGEFLNADYKEHDLLSLSVHPGSIPTELAKQMPEEVHKFLIDAPELAADTMIWLTAERRDWLRGRYVSCNWDLKELLDKREQIVKDDLLKVRMDVGML
ncbi:Putative short-chain dehydrogenase/reductase SDR, NAD(P)-binding domain superfamily [Septoria linicola]|uniref:Short-chain dehydrogenase/reductase SDR, NAD(P)-binding domain superfamily n=1 Tax=Septoria linicola TaxID=215465 RepID=A0A9Q9AJY3_9PEZI|nr:putative short-chain dehydrogenase/reductase SDR, NAD(P)-binding domain superfamily [Septoria linicola]USW50719.1 Putative short-chain dehydrogenase/reductase SDR, NAD(P)-binding domain superfamily [Septoria linicola]